MTGIEGFRLSPQQQRLWKLQEEGGSYRVRGTLRLRGPLDRRALLAALAHLAGRHEILRTTFHRLPGMKLPIQAVGDDPGAFACREIDLRTRKLAEKRRELERLRRDSRPDRPLANLSLVALEESEHLLFLSLPGLLADPTSMVRLVTELGHLYAAIRRGESPNGEPPMQYVDYSEWQKEGLEEEESREGKTFWRQQNLPDPDRLRLPFEPPEAADGGFERASLPVSLEAGRLAELEAVAERYGVSVTTLMVAAFTVLMGYFADERDIVVNTAFDGRNYEELEQAVGLFVRYLPLRIRLRENSAFSELIQDLEERMRDAETWQEYFTWDGGIVSSHPEGSEPGVLAAGFDLVELPEELSFGDLSAVIEEVESDVERFKVRLSAVRTADRLGLRLDFSRNLLQVSDAARLGEALPALLRSVIERPESPLCELDTLSEIERKQLATWGGTRAPEPQEPSIQRLFEAQAERTPDAVALLFGTETLTYGDLDRRTNTLAQALRRRGVGREGRVGLFFERSAEMVVALLAVLKAGAAYVALHPAHPAERLRRQVEEIEPTVLLKGSTLPGPPLDLPCEVMGVADAIGGETAAPAAVTEPHHLAYIVHTSGSTGRPKGVAISHGGVVNYLTFLRRVYALQPSDVVLQVPELIYDASVRDLLAPLCAGARVVVMGKAQAKDPSALLRHLGVHRVTAILSIVPTFLRALLDGAEVSGVGSFASLRLVVASGEVLRSNDCLRVRESLGPRAEVVNQYGPTECTMTSSYYPVPLEPRDPLPIGQPIPNARFHLLDRWLRPVPIGAGADLYIGGPGLSRGYFKRPGLTADVFSPDPLGGEPGQRIYRTGDQARYRADGQVEFLGRRDHQIKLRGVRIEPGEIESTLLSHPAVKRAVVVSREDPPRDPRLVAYVVTGERPRTPIPEKKRYVLPNELPIAHLNKYETDFFYQQIFDDQVELRHGIELSDGDVVFDVGANIGLFTLFLHHTHRNLRIFAFEPIPEIFATLSTNVEHYAVSAQLFNCGLSSTNGETVFAYYPYSTCQSGYYPDVGHEKRMLEGIIFQHDEGADDEVARSYLEGLVEDRMESMPVTCRLSTVSEVMAEHAIPRIDLLKIDVEKSELDVLRGIRPEDWPKIRQIVIEGHDLEGRLDQLIALLEEQGYEVAAEKDVLLEDTCLFNVYARSEISNGTARKLQLRQVPASGATPSAEELRSFLAERLPEALVPAAFVELKDLPRTSNGKLDRAALPAPELNVPEEKRLDRSTFTPTEEIVAGIWAEVLGVPEVALDDDFFAVGGHSLIGTQVVMRINEAFEAALPLQKLFESPTVEGLAAHVDEAVRSRNGMRTPPLQPVPREGDLPLSFDQQRLWFLHQLQPDNPLYNLPGALRLEGRLELGVLRRTIDEIVRRHESLRTSFSTAEGQPVQVVAPPAAVPLSVVDVSGLDEARRRAHVDRLVTWASRRTFDLERGPLVRLLLLRESEERHVVHFSMHHIISDAWSMGVLVREVTALFGAFSHGAPSPLPELPVQYADYAHWQRQWLQGEVLDRQLDYWKRQLDGAPELLELPVDRPRGPVRGFRGGRHSLELSQTLNEAILRLSQEERVTLFMTLLAGLMVTLHGSTGGEDMVIGTDVAHRSRTQTEGLIGFFVNQLVLRTRLSGDPDFRELLGRVHRAALEGYAHQELPFEKLVEALRPARSLDHHPLFQVKLVLQNTPRSFLELPGGLTASLVEVESVPAREDLLLNAVDTGAGLLVNFKYNADLFEPATIARMAGHFERALELGTERPGMRLSELRERIGAADREERMSQTKKNSNALGQKLKNIKRRSVSRHHGEKVEPCQ